MSYFVYVLKSLVNGDIYVGQTKDLKKRINLHNSGRVKSTKAYKPWIFLESRELSSRAEAMKLEKFLKNHQQKEIIKIRYGHVAKG